MKTFTPEIHNILYHMWPWPILVEKRFNTLRNWNKLILKEFFIKFHIYWQKQDVRV
jgi:hypothetical protein